MTFTGANTAKKIYRVLVNCVDTINCSIQSSHSVAVIIVVQSLFKHVKSKLKDNQVKNVLKNALFSISRLQQLNFWKNIKLNIQKYLAHAVAK